MDYKDLPHPDDVPPEERPTVPVMKLPRGAPAEPALASLNNPELSAAVERYKARQEAQQRSVAESVERFKQRMTGDAAKLARIESYKLTDAAKAMSPEEAADLYKFSTVVPSDVPMEDVRKQLPDIKRAVQDPEHPFDWVEHVRTSPTLSKYLNDQVAVPQIAADSSQLKGMEMAITGKFEVDWSAADGREAFSWTPPAGIERMVDVLRNLPKQLMIGLRGMGDAAHIQKLTPAEEAADKATLLEIQRQLNKDYIGKDRNALTKGFAYSTMMLAETIPVIAAGAAGGAVGGPAGALAMTAAYLAPLKFPEHKEFVGNKETALATSVIGSTLEAALFAKGFGSQMGLNKRVVDAMFPELAARTMTQLTPGRLAAIGAQNFTQEMLGGAATMTLAGIMDRSMKNVGRWGVTGQTPDNVLDGAGEEFLHALAGMPLLAAWGATRHVTHEFAKDVNLWSVSYGNKRMVDVFTDSALASKLRKSNQPFFEQLVREMGVQPGSATHLYLDTAVFEEACVKAGLDPYKVVHEIMKDRGALWDEARTGGSADIAFPLERAHRLLNAKEFAQVIRDHGRFNPEALSAMQLMERAKFYEELAKKPEITDEGDQFIYDDAYERTLDALKKADTAATPKPETEDPNAYSPEKAAKGYATMILATTRLVMDRIPGITKEQAYEFVFAATGIGYGGPNQPRAVGPGLYEWAPDRKIWFDKDGKLRPVSIKDLIEGHLAEPDPSSPLGFKIADMDRAKTDPAYAATLKAVPIRNKLGSAGAWWSPQEREMLLFGPNRGPSGSATNLIHEHGHMLVDIFGRLAFAHPNEFAADFDMLVKAMGYKDAKDRFFNYNGGNEEKASIWLEEFFRRGKSPTPELAETFGLFSHWIRQFYYMSDKPFDPTKQEFLRSYSPEEYWAAYATKLDRQSVNAAWQKLDDAAKISGKPRPPAPVHAPPRTKADFGYGDTVEGIFGKFLGAEQAIARFTKELSLLDKKVAEYIRKEGLVDEHGILASSPSATPHDVARQRLMKVIADSERTFFKKTRDQFKAIFQKELEGHTKFDIPEVRTQRWLAWFRDGTTWGPWPDDLKEALTNPDTGKPYKLDFKTVRNLMGPEVAKRMADRKLTSTNPKNSMTPQEILEAMQMQDMGLGLDIREFLQQLHDAPRLEDYLKIKSHEAVKQQYGYELLDDPAELHKAALDASMNEKQVQKRLVLIRALAQDLAGDKARLMQARMSDADWKALAARLMEDKTLRQIQPERYYNSMITADKRALKHMEAGEITQAFDAVQKAVLNHYLYKAARELDTSMEAAFEKIKDKTTTDKWRSVLGFADPAYRNMHDAILVAIGLMENHPAPEIDPKQFLPDLLAKVKENGQDHLLVGWDPIALRDLITQAKSWSSMTPEEARLVYNAILNIHKLAEEINDVRLGEKRLKIRDMQESFEVSLYEAGLGQVFEPQDPSITASKMKSFMSGVGSLRASLMEPRTWLRYFGKETYDTIIDSFVKARDYKDHLLKTVMGEFEKSWIAYDGKDTMFGVTPGIADALRVPGQSGEVSKRWLTHVMLWMGSESSRAKLLRYTKWTPEQVLEAAGKFLTRADLEWIQAQHDLADKHLKPLIAKAHEERYGLPFEEVKALGYKVKLADGTEVNMRGGYYPVRYSRKGSRIGLVKDMESIDENGLNGLYPKVSDAYMNERTGYVDKPDLNWNGYPSHIQRVIHDLAYGDWVHNTAKFFLNRRTQAIMNERLGDAIASQPLNWLKAVAFEGQLAPHDWIRPFDTVLQRGRATLAAAGLGWNAAIFGAHVFHPFAVGAIQQRGFGFNLTNTVPAYAKTMYSWALSRYPGGVNEHYEWAKQTFSEVAHRASTTVDEYREFSSQLNKPPSSKIGAMMQKISATQMFFIKHGDAMVSTVIATARYEGEMARGATHEEAVKAANRAVAESMPTHNPMEMPDFTRNKHGVGGAIIFYGYWSKLLQMMESRRAEDVMAGQSGDMMKIAEMAGSTMAMLIYAEVMGAYFMGHGKDQDEDWATWAARRGAGAPFRMYPLVANFSQPAIDNMFKDRKKAKTSPISLPAFAPYEMLVRNYEKITNRRSTTDEKAFAAVEAVLTGQALFTGVTLPVRAPMRAAHYGYGLMAGHERPRGPGDVVSGFAFGHSRKYQAETPFTTFDTITQGGHP